LTLEYIRRIDLKQLASTNDRVSMPIYGPDSGATHVSVNCVKTPPGGGSIAGLHSHAVDQLFYIISGTMTVEIGGEEFKAGPGTVVVFPADTPHRNWNEGTEATVHLAINAPLPDPNVPFARPA
jgi:mannose-6-phosphate isomerase-like protein (cupin superfamily)